MRILFFLDIFFWLSVFRFNNEAVGFWRLAVSFYNEYFSSAEPNGEAVGFWRLAVSFGI